MWSLLVAKPCDETRIVLMEHLEGMDWSDSLAHYLTEEWKTPCTAEQAIQLYSLLATSDNKIHAPALVRSRVVSFIEYRTN